MLVKKQGEYKVSNYYYDTDYNGEYHIESLAITHNCQLSILGQIGDLLDSVEDNSKVKLILKELVINEALRILGLVDIHDQHHERFIKIVEDCMLAHTFYKSTSGSKMHVIVFNATKL